MDQQWLGTLHWIQNSQAFGVGIKHAVWSIMQITGIPQWIPISEQIP